MIVIMNREVKQLSPIEMEEIPSEIPDIRIGDVAEPADSIDIDISEDEEEIEIRANAK